LPPAAPGDVEAAKLPKNATTFPSFERLMRFEDVEQYKGMVDPERILMPVLIADLPVYVKDPVEAAALLRKAGHLLTLLANQCDQIGQSAPVRFALCSHVMSRILPMPLPLDDPKRKETCFWQSEMKYETKVDLMRNLHLITRHFSSVAFTLRADRETDGARVCVAAAMTAIMDALMRRPCHPDATPLSMAYSGEMPGPSAMFGLDCSEFERGGETLLLVTPELACLRCLVLDYFRSIRSKLQDDHVIFQFEQIGGVSEETDSLSIKLVSPWV